MLDRLITKIRSLRYGMRSKHIKERPFNVTVDGETRQLFHSAFNTAWMGELGIQTKTIVELGSFDGGDAYRFRQDFPDARIVTVEADPTRYGVVQSNLAGQNIEIVNCAACATDGDIDWFVSTVDGEPQAQGSMFQHSQSYQKKFPQVQQSNEPIKVSGRRFDSLAKDLSVTDVDLLHMDIEGAEHNVLKTLGDINPRLIYLEWRQDYFRNTEGSAATEKLLTDRGYKLILLKTSDRLYFLPE